MTGDRSALSGVLVADFSRVLAAPYATMLMADLGATVIKVERPGGGDDTRSWGPPYVADQATYFRSVNRNKRSLTLDLGEERDRRRARELARRADVVVENFRPGTMDKFGLSYERVRAGNPGVVYCSISAFGAAEGAALPGYDLLLQAVGGLMSITGSRPDEPTKVGVALVDVLAGLHASVGILAALRYREATGRGQHVEVNLLSSLLSGMVNQSAGYTMAGVVPGIMGNRHPSIVPYEVFDTADRPLALAVGTDAQFAALCRALGAGDLLGDDRFADNPSRVAHAEALRARLTEILGTRKADEWYELLTPAGVPCGPVNDLAGAFALAERLGLHPRVAGDLVANPIGLSETPVEYRTAPPLLGVDDAELLAWLDSD
ncbi:CaiB/BaiF CoA transferase family protein [Nocardia pseudobrasiliensis]|uniref:Crotonobetainyl-CoA:carnitine CoA-transferase CaiB-like acyl-CoA transferase n=1 Tax=Nocardia pseudobrasiliensis TaxID=45979 RepID=A0A370IEE6_9NOCA|nr:CoA transferase [Nocardia pseudobrasiliensis]RDI69102.1 crotonobetainyl-CoA:carnitine CoA-transferase CaiB-like acyl-CoA transferase [Nocardia pseudobrasiliensis]